MRIKLASVFVDDQDKALAFYTSVLGFEKSQDVPLGEFRWLTVQSKHGGDAEVVLEPTALKAAKVFQEALYEQNIPLTAFETDDIHAEFDRLKNAGVEFLMEPTDAGTTTIAVFSDTCGNWIQIYQQSKTPE